MNELTIIEPTDAQPAKLKWFTLNQNNSGGVFTVDENVAEWVCIQALSAEEAMAKAEAFCTNEGSCPCCGDRWYINFDEEDGKQVPMIYNTPVEEYVPIKLFFAQERHIKLHFYDGHVETLTAGTEQQKRIGAKS
jgi:hypothetical protein